MLLKILVIGSRTLDPGAKRSLSCSRETRRPVCPATSSLRRTLARLPGLSCSSLLPPAYTCATCKRSRGPVAAPKGQRQERTLSGEKFLHERGIAYSGNADWRSRMHLLQSLHSLSLIRTPCFKCVEQAGAKRRLFARASSESDVLPRTRTRRAGRGLQFEPGTRDSTCLLTPPTPRCLSGQLAQGRGRHNFATTPELSSLVSKLLAFTFASTSPTTPPPASNIDLPAFLQRD